MFMLFSALMTWMRQYLVLHTGNRIDAVLGQNVFRHLLRLPLPYFEQRPTGTLVARLQGIENIRQFVAGAAVTLLLDCPFLLIFLAVMFWYSWQLTLIALGALLLIAGLSLAVTPVFRARLDRHAEEPLIEVDRALRIRHRQRHVVERASPDRRAGLREDPGRERQAGKRQQ